MEDAESRVRLRISEAGVEVVPPSRNAGVSGVVCPFGGCALEVEFGEDLRDLVVWCDESIGAERVGGFDCGDESGVVAEERLEVGCCVVLAHCEDAGGDVSGCRMCEGREQAYRPSWAFVPVNTGM